MLKDKEVDYTDFTQTNIQYRTLLSATKVLLYLKKQPSSEKQIEEGEVELSGSEQ